MPKNFRAVHILKFLEEEHSEDGLPITLPCYAERVPITYLLNFIISVKWFKNWSMYFSFICQ